MSENMICCGMNIYFEAISAAKLAAETNRDENQQLIETKGAPEIYAVARALTFLRSFVIPELTEARMALELCDVKADVGSGGNEVVSRSTLLIHGIPKPLTFTTAWAPDGKDKLPAPSVRICDGVNPGLDCRLDPGEIRQAILAFVTNSIRELAEG